MDFEMYQGDSISLISQDLRHGPAVILRLVQTFPSLFFSIGILLHCKLFELNIYNPGTCVDNPTSGIKLVNRGKVDRSTCTEHAT